MDQQEIKLIAQFRTLYSKETNNKFDLVRFANENAYAKQILEQAAQTSNEELLMITMELMNRRGFFSGKEKAEEKSGDKLDSKYVGKLR